MKPIDKIKKLEALQEEVQNDAYNHIENMEGSCRAVGKKLGVSANLISMLRRGVIHFPVALYKRILESEAHN